MIQQTCSQKPFELIKTKIEVVVEKPLYVDEQEIIYAACELFHVGRFELLGMSRIRKLSDIRKICYRIIQKYIRKSTLTNTGKIFSDRDHSTVINGINSFWDLYLTCPEFRLQYNRLDKKVKEISEKKLL